MKYLNAFFYLQNSYKSEETQREDNKSVHSQMVPFDLAVSYT